jgi:hypothetical protein
VKKTPQIRAKELPLQIHRVVDANTAEAECLKSATPV